PRAAGFFLRVLGGRALVLLAVLAVVRDVETRTLEVQAGSPRNLALRPFTALRAFEHLLGRADRPEEMLELMAFRAAILVRRHGGGGNGRLGGRQRAEPRST